MRNKYYLLIAALLQVMQFATAQTAVSFQQGVAGYAGGSDVSISNQYGGNGSTARSALIYAHHVAAYEHRPLIAFKNLTIPAGLAVAKATLELTVVSWSANSLTGSYLNSAWNETGAVGWLKRDTTLNWSQAGASGAGTDTLASPVIVLPQLKATGEQRISVPLDAATVQAWISQPARNFGIVIRNLTTGTSAVTVASYRHATIAKRPKLVLSLAASATAPDITAPLVSLVSPVPGTQVSGGVTMEASATDESGIKQVEFLVDGVSAGQPVVSAPYRLTLDSRLLTDGLHTVVVKATDTAGNQGVSATASITVSNPVATPAPVSSLLAPPAASGQVDVQLVPTSAVVPGRTVLVTFGLPLSRGSVQPGQLDQIRVMQGSLEQAAYVEMLTPWRHATAPLLDQQSVRVARIQFWHTFTGTAPETVTVNWGATTRALNLTSLTPPRTAWHLVQDQGFLASDGVYEPDVYAVLPAAYLANGVLSLATAKPFDATVTEARSDPAQALAATWTGFAGLQQTEKNFFYTLINQDDPRVSAANLNPFRTDFEPWLYDRATAMYQLYFQSGFPTVLRQAVRNAQFYAANIYPTSVVPAVAAGLFRLKMPVPALYGGGNTSMYSYNESLAYTYWLTGDDTLVPVIGRVATAHRANTEPVRWSPTMSMWTERHVAYRILAEAVWYEVSGDLTARDNIKSSLVDLTWHQNGAAGQLPAGRVDGGLYHTATQHGEPGGATLLASPWMSALLAKPVARVYCLTDDNAAASFLVRLATFLRTVSRADTLHMYSTTTKALRYPDYLTNADGTPNNRSSSDVEHTMDVLSAIAWGYYFTKESGTPDQSLQAAAIELYSASEIGFKYWTRPAAPASGATAFRLAPWRKYGWQFSGAGNLPWLLQ